MCATYDLMKQADTILMKFLTSTIAGLT